MLKDRDTTVFALVTLFTKHPELVIKYKANVLSDLISHASTETIVANLINLPYAQAKATIKASAEFTEKKVRFIANL